MSEASDILLGMGNSLDYDLRWRPDVLSGVAAELGIVAWPTPPEVIRDEGDLVSAVLAYAAAGVGTERSVESVPAIESLAHRLGYHESLGGTGVRAGRVVDLLGIACTVHLTSLTPRMEALLWPGAHRLSGGTARTDYPHLIVQYGADRSLTVGGVTRTPPRPNRLIFVNDPDNAELVLAPDLRSAVAASSIWLISGFNAITDPSLLATRLGQVGALIKTMRPGAWAVYEDAGFHRPELAATALSTMAGACDVVGMNEDEFAGHLGTAVDLDDATAVGNGLAALAGRWPVNNLVVHTSRWAAATGPQAHQLRAAMTEGVLAGAARFTSGDAMNRDVLSRLRSAPKSPSGTAVAAGLERAGLAAVPALELNPPDPVTVGLGDSFVGGFVAGLYRSGVRADRGVGQGLNPAVT